MNVNSLGEFAGEVGDFFVLEGYRAIGKGEEGVVAALLDVLAGMKLRAALSDDDFTGMDDLAAKALHAEALGYGVSAELGGSARFSMRHKRRNRGNKAQDTAFRRACQASVRSSEGSDSGLAYFRMGVYDAPV